MLDASIFHHILYTGPQGILIDTQPGCPTQNAFIERFNRTYREEVLDMNMFSFLKEAQQVTKKWIPSYNSVPIVLSRDYRLLNFRRYEVKMKAMVKMCFLKWSKFRGLQGHL